MEGAEQQGAVVPDQRLGPKRRLKKRKEFLYVQDKGEKTFAKHFLLIHLSRAEADDIRLGITVTTKVHKRAVRRNKLKRRVREIIRTLRAEINHAGDIVIIARKGATELSFAEVERDMRYMLRKAGLLKKPGGARRDAAAQS